MRLIEKQKPCAKVFVCRQADETVLSAAHSFIRVVERLCGVTLCLEQTDAFITAARGVAFATFDTLGDIRALFAKEEQACLGDGFCVKAVGDCVFVTAKLSRGVYFGAHDLLEKNTNVVFARGAAEENVAVLQTDTLDLTEIHYAENSPFAVRSWNACGMGTDGQDHADEGTAEYFGRNKSNGVEHRFEKGWKRYGLFGAGVCSKLLGNLDELSADHPEWFMTAPDGGVMPALGGYESFFNYYDKGIAEAFAYRVAQAADEVGEGNIPHWTMPDNPYFYMRVNGVNLHEQPFTADDGTTVYPHESHYKSTVYFNFLNRVIKKANEIRPNTQLHVFAYTYSEHTPAIAVDKRLIVTIAPIQTNDKYAYDDTRSHDNDAIRNNILRWRAKTDNLEMYMYWCSFRGTIYSRPILEVVKRNLLWFEKIGIKRVLIEGKVDCSLLENPHMRQAGATKFYDMNEAYVWAIQRLMWNPNQDTQKLIRRFCKIVYKECAKEMLAYFTALQKGWDKKDALVWYTTGGDVYYLQFILGAGVDEEILSALENAKAKAVTPEVARKVNVIYQTVQTEIAKYRDFIREEGKIVYCGAGEETILSPKHMDFENNASSVWNTAIPLRVLRDYNTMAHYPKQANFACRMLYDDKHIYIGYSVSDDQLIEKRTTADGVTRYYRDDGSELISYVETYIGGNVFNQETYYGYISGFMGERNPAGQFYENKGTPKSKPIPEGVRDVKFVRLDEHKEKRYYFHVQVIPYAALGAAADNCNPYGSFVYYTNRFERAGWMGYGLWSKQNFSPFVRLPKQEKINEKGDK
ncbi:MAG: DUF4838 domain-containing protein [Clostridia bacterium]|nr:DUF4838 domain-containing protein [Clostridia bacterium]